MATEAEAGASNPQQQRQAAEDDADDVNGSPTHHPFAPSHELFDLPTTIDLGYIISLIRKLLPLDGSQSENFQGPGGRSDSSQRPQTGVIDDVAHCPRTNGVVSDSNGNIEATETHTPSSSWVDDEATLRTEQDEKSTIENAWEESGCILWDLAANNEHAGFMVQNFVLEVLLANLRTSDSARVREICLGIIGNLACHEILMNRVISTDGLLEITVDQLFSDDTPCLCEVCRLLTLGLQGRQCVVWAKALQSEHILRRVLWIVENTLNPFLIERSVLLLLAIMENQHEAASALLPTLMNLGLSTVLVNLLAFEMRKLRTERMPERYVALDSILRAIEALSVIDGYSEEICSNKELFQMAMELVKVPEKIEFSSSCVTAVVLIANILVDSTDLVLETSRDFLFLQSLLDLFPFTSDDYGARNALWSILAKLLLQVQETGVSPSSLSQYVQMIVSGSDLIEDALLDSEWETSTGKHEEVATYEAKLNSRTTATKLIINMLNNWSAVKKSMSPGKNDEDSVKKDLVDDKDVDKLLKRCVQHSS